MYLVTFSRRMPVSVSVVPIAFVSSQTSQTSQTDWVGGPVVATPQRSVLQFREPTLQAAPNPVHGLVPGLGGLQHTGDRRPGQLQELVGGDALGSILHRVINPCHAGTPVT